MMKPLNERLKGLRAIALNASNVSSENDTSIHWKDVFRIDDLVCSVKQLLDFVSIQEGHETKVGMVLHYDLDEVEGHHLKDGRKVIVCISMVHLENKFVYLCGIKAKDFIIS